MKHQTFVQKVVAFIKGGDEAKVARFETKVVKYLKRQLSMREDELESLRDKLVDAKEHLSEVVVSVDTEKISTSDALETYTVAYVGAVAIASNEVSDLEDEIEDLEAEIERCKELELIIFPAE